MLFRSLRRPAAVTIVREHQGRLGFLAERFLIDVAARNQATWRSSTKVLGRIFLSTVDAVLFDWLIDRDDARTEAALEWLTATIAADAAP